ncbi:hypothetical protein HS088_TW01G00998 [Tripterygium wilfordii]|uniref:Uncharacterized protein n=2 Tax=Tripterygium wilfordii TaxID=458696 RepID=A0A7J7E3H3_TRIWF|nr:hypothetical protein HS088_TW01G00998 [Tripterygium wilfordii]
MEKPWKLKLKLKSKSLNFLPKTATPATSLNSPRSPVRSPVRRGSTRVSLVPKEARRRSKNGSFDWREPTSPKVSCLGQITRSKKTTENNKPSLASPQKASSPAFPSPRKQIIMIGKILKKGSKSCKKSEDEDRQPPSPPKVIVSAPPSLGRMKQFESGRGGALHQFDWKNTVSDGDDDKVVLSSLEAMDEKVGAEGRKEVNLWRRRSLAPPTPLQI